MVKTHSATSSAVPWRARIFGGLDGVGEPSTQSAWERPLVQANALQLPFADDSFDKVICSEVLEHIPDYQSALRDIERVLKPGGLFCASVPRRWPEKICWALSEGYYSVPGGHLRIFRGNELRREIEVLGFKFYHRHWAALPGCR